MHRSRDFAVVLAAAAQIATVLAVAVPAQAATYTLTIGAMAFSPPPSGLKVGDVMVWMNHDLFEHSVTARNGSFDLDLPPGKSGQVTLKAPGAIDFYCRFHPGMTGRLVVSPAKHAGRRGR